MKLEKLIKKQIIKEESPVAVNNIGSGGIDTFDLLLNKRKKKLKDILRRKKK